MPQKRQVTSCSTCRRLRTRCEKLPGFDVCRRCDRLRIECSFPSARPPPSPRAVHRVRKASTHNESSVDMTASIHQRLASIDTALSEIRSLLSSSAAPQAALPSRSSSPTASADHNPHLAGIDGHTSLSDPMQAYARTAPISVVRDMRHIIIGTVPGAAPDEPVLDCVSLGLVTQSLSNTLLEGARTIPFQRYGLTSTLEEACPESPLLFATCLLLGIYVIPNLCNSRLHVALYTHVEDMVTKALLRTPLSIETVQAFLLISLWHTVPLEKERYIDSWLMSGMAIMHGTLSIDLSKDSEEETENRRMLRRTWNALCLAHLQFSVGTGRPPIIGTSNMGAFLTDLECPDVGDTDDQIIVAQSQLYSMLYDLITCQAPSLNMICDKIEGWKSKYEVLLEADDSYSLAFSYSCAYLILYRHSLKILTDPASPFYPLDVPGDDIETRMQALVNLALDHSSKIMNLYAKIAALYGNVPPVFAYLMCVNAAITVVEFKQDLKNPGEIFKLMERLHLSFHDPGNDPVFEWAVNVMKKACAESRGDSA